MSSTTTRPALRSLPPVRRAVAMQRTTIDIGKATLLSAFDGYDVHLLDSGTTALALALADARQQRDGDSLEAILPAYGCPQLVAACLFASVRPRLVDVAGDGWGYDLEALGAALSGNTVAVLAVNLLGVGDQATQIAGSVRDRGALLIQDSAQYLPGAREIDWIGRYVVLSFGRGKPLNLLRGGALLVPEARPLGVPVPAEGSRFRDRLMGSRGAAAAFNIATHPLVYGLASRLPGLGVGTTRFAPLEKATSLPDTAWSQLGPAFEEYSRESRACPWSGFASEFEALGFDLLRDTSGVSPREGRRLRFALLAETAGRREAVLRSLERQGLGASRMYGASLDQIPGIPEEVRRQGPFPNAAAFAERLLTLPTHSHVTEETVTRVLACMRSTSG